MKRYLLFVEYEANHDFVDLLSQNLKIDISNICLFRFEKKVNKKDDCKNFITIKDFGLFGKLINETKKERIEKPFDLVINFTTNNEFVSSIIASLKAGFKVGLLDKYSQASDLIIDVESDDSMAFCQELKKYLEILKKL